MTSGRLQHIIKRLDWSKLTPWEENFVASVEAYFSRYRQLPERHEEILENLFRNKGQQ